MSGGGQSTPHDAVFRRVLGEPVNAASQLRAVLPQALAAQLDLDRLTPVPGSFVDEGLRWRHSDLLFTAPLAGRQSLIYVLIEHQRTQDPLMPMRMLRYMVRIWDRYLAEHPGVNRLPVVIPLVIHQNTSPWTAPTELLDLLDLDPQALAAAGSFLPRFRFLLDARARLDARALRERPLTAAVRVTLLLLKIAPGNPDLLEALKGWADDLRAVLKPPGGLAEFTSLLSYIYLVGETPDEHLHRLVATLSPEAEEAYVTTAEMLRAEGEARGRAEGEARGRAEGEARGRAQTLVEQLTLKFGPLPPTALDTIRRATPEQLKAWTARVLTADTLEHVLD